MISTFPEISHRSFHSKSLGDALQKHSHVFEFHQQDLNSVSEDIKNLESYLKSKNISISHNEVYESNSEELRYRLSWNKHNEESKVFRLFCGVEEFKFDDGIWMVLEEKPLIESPLATRMATYRYLPAFIMSLAKAIAIYYPKKTTQNTANYDDIPF